MLLETLGVRRERCRAAGRCAGGARSARAASSPKRCARPARRSAGAAAPRSPPRRRPRRSRHVAIVEAANEREEALAVAAILRGAIETPGRTAALVTPDRGLARRVAVELQRWGIEVDDSAGRPLARSAAGVLARLVAETALGGATAETLLALAEASARGVRHESGAGARARRGRWSARSCAGRACSRRSPRLRHALVAAIATSRLTPSDADERPSEAARAAVARRLGRGRRARARASRRRCSRSRRLAERAARCRSRIWSRRILQAIAARARRRAAARPIAGGEDGEALARAFEELSASAAQRARTSRRATIPALFAALIERAVVRRRGGLDPRIHIWGALEARLQSVDVVVLGGLNEGTWPSQTRLDPLLSRPMRAALALEPPERRIGLAAHDFAQALGQPEVWLTRADAAGRRAAGRLALAAAAHRLCRRGAGRRRCAARGAAMLALARRLDRPHAADRAEAARARRRRSSCARSGSRSTRIETLIRDPYAIYAQYVLKLQPFEPLAKLPDAAERGIADPRHPGDVRRASGRAARSTRRGRAAPAGDRPRSLCRARRFPRGHRALVAALRADRALVRAAEAARDGRRGAPCRGDRARMEVTPDFALSVARRPPRPARRRQPRHHRLQDRHAAVDRRGAVARRRSCRSKALIARRGGFEGIAAGGAVGGSIYYRLSGRGEGGEVHERSVAAGEPRQGRR